MDSDARLAEMHEQLMQIRAASEVTEEKLRSEVRRNQQQMSLFCKVMFMWCYACHDDPMKWWRLHHVGGANHPWSGYIFLKFKCVLMCSSLSGARKGIPPLLLCMNCFALFWGGFPEGSCDGRTSCKGQSRSNASRGCG